MSSRVHSVATAQRNTIGTLDPGPVQKADGCHPRRHDLAGAVRRKAETMLREAARVPVLGNQRDDVPGKEIPFAPGTSLRRENSSAAAIWAAFDAPSRALLRGLEGRRRFPAGRGGPKAPRESRCTGLPLVPAPRSRKGARRGEPFRPVGEKAFARGLGARKHTGLRSIACSRRAEPLDSAHVFQHLCDRSRRPRCFPSRARSRPPVSARLHMFEEPGMLAA